MEYKIKDSFGLELAPELVNSLICSELGKCETKNLVNSWDKTVVKPWIEGFSSWEQIKDYWCDCTNVEQEAGEDCVFYYTIVRPVIEIFKKYQWEIISL